MRRVYEGRWLKRGRLSDIEQMEQNEGEDGYEKIKPLDSINPYCILVSTKGALALVTSFDEEISNKGEDYENGSEIVRLVKEDESDDEEVEDSLGGFEKVRYDAPELKLGLTIIF
jgi:hypothetical protein